MGDVDKECQSERSSKIIFNPSGSRISEEAFGDTISGPAVGIVVTGGVTYGLGQFFSLLAGAGYRYASKSNNDTDCKRDGLGVQMNF